MTVDLNSGKTIVLTFDDAVSNHASFVGPLLRRHGFGATFYVCEFPPDFAENKRQYMTWEQIRELDAAGFEIGNHTLTHARVTEISDEQFEAELEAIHRRCAAWGIRRPATFAYPVAVARDSADPVLIRNGYRLARIGGARPFVPGRDPLLRIPSFPVHGDDPAPFRDAVASAAPGVIPVLMFHGVPEYAHPWVNTPPERFAASMDALAAGGFHVVALRDLLAALGDAGL
ncbi:MAG: polysaccharide deacetylase family protein [Planctomycetes bacterium]|nr:polysaccharide deacetylase family protein [Planctomycetota bacterium]